MPYEFIDLASPDLGEQLKKNAKGELPIDVWRHYVLHHSYSPNPEKHWADVIHYCDEPVRATLDPQKAVDDASRILAITLFTTPQGSYTPLAKGIWDAYIVLGRAHSSRRQRGQPTSMQRQAVRAYIIRKFNPDPDKPGESSVTFAQTADLLFKENGKCPHCRTAEHKYDDHCVRRLEQAVRNLRSAMKHDGIPT